MQCIFAAKMKGVQMLEKRLTMFKSLVYGSEVQDRNINILL